MDCQKKMTCMEDSKWAIAVRAVAVYIYGSGSFGTNKPILVKWRWNTLTQRVLQVVPGTTKSPVSGGETPSPPAEEKDPHNGGKKALCSPYITFWARCRSRGFGWRMEFARHGRSEKLRLRHSPRESRLQSPRLFRSCARSWRG